MAEAMRWWWLAALVPAACGGRIILVPDDGSPGDAPIDAGASGDGDAESPLPPCRDHADCFGAQSCQQGRCCAGVMVDGTCRCGDGPACDVRMTCCTNKEYPVPTCVFACGLDPPPPPGK